MNQIRIGVMGCANIARRTMIPTILASPAFTLKAVASRTTEKANSFSQEFGCDGVAGYEELLQRNDIDAIYMPLPTGLHEEWVIKCLEAGKHILVEKSFAMDYESANKMISLAKEKSLVVMEDFMFLYHSQHQFVKSLIDSGEIGELRVFRSSFGFPPFTDDNFRYSKALGGGALLDAAAYTIRASSFFLGKSLKLKSAQLNFQDKEVDTHGGAFLVNDKGVVAQTAFGFDNFYQCNYELWGSKGKITAHKSFTPRANEKPLITVEKQDQKFQYNAAADDHFRNILAEFHDSISNETGRKHYRDILNQSSLLMDLLNTASM